MRGREGGMKRKGGEREGKRGRKRKGKGTKELRIESKKIKQNTYIKEN